MNSRSQANFTPISGKQKPSRPLGVAANFIYLHAPLLLVIPVEQVPRFLPSGCLEEWHI